ncbi:cob(I)yrinic acid a,c-diamide adenosyltransferase [Wukongibacter baidiensis]|uniref:cob(I)yrinic acid a,c-diamide adenosyltransferase n=1 Tax=Wukongibacter baidiensis TaxID=1723361 RepID=UPI003D7F5213
MGKVYTKTGDKGETGLFGGSRISKDDLRVDCYGTVDEVISIIGVAYSIIDNMEIKEILRYIQKKLFSIGAELASDEKGYGLLKDKVAEEDVTYLENLIDKYLEKVGPQKSFIIPGKTTTSATLHVARTTVRRAERKITKLAKEASISNSLIKYINRLSDVLFILARVEEEKTFMDEVKGRVMERLKMISNKNILTLGLAKKMARAAEEKANSIGVSIVYSIADLGGNLILLHKMEDALLASTDISINKAYTSVALKMPTDKVADLVQPGSELYGIQWTNNNRIVTFGGGYPLKASDKIIGGIGVSGGTVEQDMEIALHSLRVFELERGI